MLERINMLKSEIDRLHKLAASANGDIAREILALIKNMQGLVARLEDDAKAIAAKAD